MKLEGMKYGGELDEKECFEEVEELMFYFYVMVYGGGLEEVVEVVFYFCMIIYGGGLEEKECFGILFYCDDWNIWW